MVVFTCGSCNEALKKAQVEKHFFTSCRNCPFVSCVDCGKDFWGNDYQEHIKCITEEAKYSGKNYVAKPNANKGEVKQEAWTEQVQCAIGNCKANPSLKSLLEKIKDYPNIPRKQAKFENFLRNSLRMNKSNLVTEAWKLLSANMPKPAAQQAKPPPSESGASENGTDRLKADNNNTAEDENSAQKDKKKKKKDKKQKEIESEEEEERKPEKRKKKRKHEADDEDEGETESKKGRRVLSEEEEERMTKRQKKKLKHLLDVEKKEEPSEGKGKKKKKRHQEVDTEVVENGKSKKKKKQQAENEETKTKGEEEEEEEEEVTETVSGKFQWEEVISTLLLKATDCQMPLKKLRKKVLAEYGATGGDASINTQEKLWAKFKKKVYKNPRLKVNKEVVTLVQ